jgi:hypothetical protein
MTDAHPHLHRFDSAAAAADRLSKLDLAAPARPVAAASGADLAAAARALVAAGMTGDAVSVLGQALEKRAAVWWACRAAQNEPAPEPAAAGPAARGLLAAEAAALAAAESWVREPDAAKAHAAFAAAHAAGMASPAACAALAAFFAGDSIAPIGGTAVPPPDHVAGLVSAGAVQLAAVRHRPDVAPQTLAAFVDRGFAIAAGRDHWEK